MAAEILAPAGGYDALVAAVRCGANAVYLGGKALNARRNASNFSDEELREAVAYCHARNVKVYLTLNTLVADSELETAYDAIECACNSHADALILQDIGLVSLVRQVCPDMPMHASTQMSVQSIEGVRELEKMGFARVVLPRELSESEIAAIAGKTDMELEYFVHGALCMCVSGQCLMSSVLGGRSGNRGLCAQPCRLPFGVNSKGGNALSLKDLSLVDELRRLEKAGICSFKIEGRMKRPEYVAAAVTACKNSLNNINDYNIDEALRAVFSRSGFTKGYFEGKLGKDMFGVRRKEDVEGAAPVLSSLARLYDGEKPLLPADMELKFKRSEPLTLKVSACGKTAAVTGDIPSEAVNKAVTEEELRDRLAKCGGTQFFAGDISIDLDEGLNAPASAINRLRRQALTELDGELAKGRDIPFTRTERVTAPHRAERMKLHARFFSEASVPDSLDGLARVILPIETSSKTLKRVLDSGAQAAVEIPPAVFSNADKYVKKLTELKENGLSLAWVCGLDGVGIARRAGLKFVCGFGMNIFNSVSVSEAAILGAEDCLLSCEVSLAQAAHIGGELPRGLMIYGRIPLMMTRNCPVGTKLTCAECGGRSYLLDRMGVRFPVRCKNGCCFVLNSRPLWLADKLNDIRNVDYGLLWFTDESKEECARVISDYRRGGAPQGEFTRGLYYKGVL